MLVATANTSKTPSWQGSPGAHRLRPDRFIDHFAADERQQAETRSNDHKQR